MSEQRQLSILAAGCAAFWIGVFVEYLSGQPLLVLAGVLAP